MGLPAVAERLADRGAIDRRLAVAIGTSLVIHALAIASLRGLLPSMPTLAEGSGSDFAALQAVLAGPPVEVETVTSPEPLAIDERLLLPPAAKPLATPAPPARQRQSPPPAAGGAVPTGAASPRVSITIATINDASRLGPDYAQQLAQRFPARVADPPELSNSPSIGYPQVALDSGAGARIVAVLTLDADGRIVDSKLVPDDPVFGPVVVNALKSAQFAPAQIDTKPVPYWTIVEFVFSVAH